MKLNILTTIAIIIWIINYAMLYNQNTELQEGYIDLQSQYNETLKQYCIDMEAAVVRQEQLIECMNK